MKIFSYLDLNKEYMWYNVYLLLDHTLETRRDSYSLIFSNSPKEGVFEKRILYENYFHLNNLH